MHTNEDFYKFSLGLGRNQNTYKFFLGFALLEFVQNQNTSIVPITYVVESFVKYAWNQSVLFKIRQNVSLNREAELIQIIKDFASSKMVDSLPYNRLDKSQKNELLQVILKRKDKFFWNPVSRFQVDYQVINSNGDQRGAGWLYSWDGANIFLTEKGHSFFKDNYETLRDIIVLQCAEFLEKYNLTPFLIEKIQSVDGFEREPFSSEIKMFFSGENQKQCFYCEKELTDKYDIDHVIPWAYVLEHKIWNLVFCCPECNRGSGGKFAQVPTTKFFEKLISRNKTIFERHIQGDEFFTEDEMVDVLNKKYLYAKHAGFKVWKGPLE